MLRLGELLEEWTHKKSVSDLAGAMSLNVDKVWLKKNGCELLVPVSEVAEGDMMIVRTGNMIPLDGKVTEGEAMVNQSSMTGESLPVRKMPGSYAYAGTVVEEGECVICADKVSGSGRYDRIVRMIEESERLKSSEQSCRACRQACSVHTRRNGACVASHAQYHKNACGPYGRFLVCSEACDAYRGAFGNAREQPVQYLR